MTVRVKISQGEYARIEIEDNGGSWTGSVVDHARHHGLDIVRALASDWGIDGDYTARTVWARFDWPEHPWRQQLLAEIYGLLVLDGVFLASYVGRVPRMTYVERADRFDAELSVAVAADDGDRRLIELLSRPGVDRRERVLVVAALGESGTGSQGAVVLRLEFADALAKLATATKSSRPDWRDIACAAVIALAQREGPAATDIYLTAIQAPNPAVRDYGMDALAAEGDDRGWDAMLAILSEMIGCKVTATRWGEMLGTIEYLARHATRGTARAEQLVALLRGQWDKLASPPIRIGRGLRSGQMSGTPIEELWPGIQPGGLAADDIDLPRLHTPAAWWRRDFKPAARLRNRALARPENRNQLPRSR